VRLSRLLREGSRTEHEAAEGAAFIGELLAGRVDEQGYADYLARLHRVYAALEEVGRDLADHPVAGVVHDRALERCAALSADREHWGAGDADTPATDAYVGRIESTRDEPLRYLAHHYTRYLGDLSGGQAIGRLLDREWSLSGAGLAFYDFAEIPRPKPYKDAYRARLDALVLSEQERTLVLDEVKRAFGLNGDLFAELSAALDSYRR
jgi:heme oxygenase